MASVRLPRFKRSAEISPFQITERDRHILNQVRCHRFLRSDHLIATVQGSPQQILRRLQLLYHHGFLERPACQIDYYQRGSRRIAYGIGRKGAGMLRRESDFPFTPLPQGDGVGRLFLEHALLTSDVMIAIERGCQGQSNVRLLTPEMAAFQGAGPKRNSIEWTVNFGNTTKCGVIPDRVFCLEFASKTGETSRTWYFLEADRGTMPVTRARLDQSSFYRKFLAYQGTWKQNIHRSRLGIDRFRVLTVTTSAERLRNLRHACSRLESGLGLFLFADQSSLLACDNILDVPWVDGRGIETRMIS